MGRENQFPVMLFSFLSLTAKLALVMRGVGDNDEVSDCTWVPEIVMERVKERHNITWQNGIQEWPAKEGREHPSYNFG